MHQLINRLTSFWKKCAKSIWSFDEYFNQKTLAVHLVCWLNYACLPFYTFSTHTNGKKHILPAKQSLEHPLLVKIFHKNLKRGNFVQFLKQLYFRSNFEMLDCWGKIHSSTNSGLKETKLRYLNFETLLNGVVVWVWVFRIRRSGKTAGMWCHFVCS